MELPGLPRTLTHITSFSTTTLVNAAIVSSRDCYWPHFNEEETEAGEVRTCPVFHMLPSDLALNMHSTAFLSTLLQSSVLSSLLLGFIFNSDHLN